MKLEVTLKENTLYAKSFHLFKALHDKFVLINTEDMKKRVI